MEQIKNYTNKELINENFSNAELPKLRDDFIAKLENALMFLGYDHLNMWHNEADKKVHLKTFDGAWLVDVSLRHNEGEGFIFRPFTDLQVTPDMFPNLNIKTMNLSGEIAHLSKYRFLTPKEKRHLAKFRYIIHEKVGFLDYGKKRWWTAQEGYGFDKINKSKKGDFRSFLPKHTSINPGYEYDDFAVNQRIIEQSNDSESPYITSLMAMHMSLQLALTYDYEWSCYIRETPDSLGVRIPIHPSSSKEVFIMRNVPEGKQRKKAILNYVKDHYRTIKNVNDEETQILIKKHLRGELKFNWRGLEVNIIPSPYDLRKIKTTKSFRTF